MPKPLRSIKCVPATDRTSAISREQVRDRAADYEELELEEFPTTEFGGFVHWRVTELLRLARLHPEFHTVSCIEPSLYINTFVMGAQTSNDGLILTKTEDRADVASRPVRYALDRRHGAYSSTTKSDQQRHPQPLMKDLDPIVLGETSPLQEAPDQVEQLHR